MLFLLDTTAFSDLMREHPRMDAHMASISEADRMIICSVVRGEIQYGIERLPLGRRRRELEAKAAKLLAKVSCVPVPEGAGDQCATTKLTRERKGLTLDENDLWIVAVALTLDAALVSRDSDFGGIDGLQVEDWTI